MATGWVVLITVVALLAGATGGFSLAHKYIQDYFRKNSPVNEDILRMVMVSMGRKPSGKKARQTTQQMKNQGE